MKAFWLELKSICRSFKVLALIIVLLSFQAMMITQFETESKIAEASETRTNSLYHSANVSWVDYWEMRYEYYKKYGKPFTPIYSMETLAFNYSWYKYEIVLSDQIKASYESKDWASYNQGMAEKRLLEWNMHGIIKRGNFVTPDQYFGKDWNLFRTMVYAPKFDQLPYWLSERMKTVMQPEQTILAAAYHLHLAKEDLPPKGPYDTSPWGFLFNFLRRGLPHILGVIVLLMTVNLLHRDKKSGVIKATLQVPRNRSRYLLKKVTLGFLSSCFVVMVPQVIMFVGLGIKHGFRGMNYPVIIDNGFLRWSILPVHAQNTLRGTPVYEFGLSQYQLPWDLNQKLSGLSRLDIVQLWQFLLLALLAMALFMLFCSVLGVLISTLVKNEIFAQAAGIGVFALGTGIGRFFPGLYKTSWDFFAKANVVPLLEGSHYASFLNSLAYLCAATVLLFVVNALIFRKQDIAA